MLGYFARFEFETEENLIKKYFNICIISSQRTCQTISMVSSTRITSQNLLNGSKVVNSKPQPNFLKKLQNCSTKMLNYLNVTTLKSLAFLQTHALALHILLLHSEPLIYISRKLPNLSKSMLLKNLFHLVQEVQ